MPKTHSDTFRQAESSATTRPAHVYIFEYRGEQFHLTGHDLPVVMTGMPAGTGSDPQTFTPAQIEHSAPNQSSEIGSNTIQLAVAINDSPLSAELRQVLLFNAPDKLEVSIVRVNALALPGPIAWGEDSFTVFRGVATHFTFDAVQIQVALVSLILNADGKMPRYFWQKRCQHALYGEQCGADPDALANHLETSIAALSLRERSIDIADVSIDGTAIEAHMFQGGKVVLFTDDTYAVEVGRVTIFAAELLPAAAGVRLFLSWWLNEMEEGSAVKVLRGCRRITVDCITFPRVGEVDLAERIVRFGGMPFIPDINPTTNGIR